MSSPKSLLIQTLEDSSNQFDQARVRDATQRLEEWRIQSGFFSTLQTYMDQEIFLDSNVPDEIRFQSIIYLKNNVDRYWRKTARSAIVDDEKVIIRQGFLQALTLHLPQPWIATNAFAIGRIARHDFPRFWPDLVSQLLSTVRNAFEIEQSGEEQWRIENALAGLAAVVKELSSVKLGMAVTAFHQVTPEIFRFLGQIYQHSSQQWVELLPALSPRTKISAKILGVMRNLLVYGFEKSGEQTDTQAFFDLAVNHFQEFYQLYNNLHGTSQDEVLRHVSKLTKLFSTYASERPFEFLIMRHAPMVVSAFVQICQHEAEQFNKSAEETDDTRLSVLGKIVIGGISTVRSLLRGVSDPKILDQERGKRLEQVAVATNTLGTIFNAQNISDLAVLLLKHFLILRQSDLNAWQEDPEEWILEVTGDVVSAESGLRIAGEALFMELVTEYKEDMTKFIANCIEGLQHLEMKTSEEIVFRESVYNAVTLNALALYDLIDFDAWLTTVIPAELAFTGPHCNIIRRRMALLISEWVGTKCSESSRPKVYETLLNLLTPLDARNDVVVRMSAATALRYAVDEWHFKPDVFLPYLDAFLVGASAEHDKGGIIGLMAFVGHIEARMKLIQVVEVIVERMDRRITPYVGSIMNLLPYLWEQSQEQRIFRGAVLSVLKTLTGALGEQSVEYHTFIVQLIALGTDPTQQEEFVYLFEDALDLWEEAVKNAPTEIKEQIPLTGPEYNFMGLFPKAIACLQLGSENLKMILKIIESYLILDPVGIMRTYASSLFPGFAEIMVGLKPEASRTVMSVVEVAIQGCPLDVYFSPLVDSGLFIKVIAAVLEENESVIITSQYMNILARVALQNPELLLHFLRTADSSQDVVSQFIDKWAGTKFDSIGQPKSRKLNAMGLTSLLRTNDPAVLSNLGSIMNVWFNVLSEVKDNEGGDALIYWREEDITGDDADFGGSYAPSAHDRRKRVFLQNDPVHTTNLMAFMKEHLAFVQNNVGGVEMFRKICLSNVDESLVDQMHTMLL